MNIQIRLVILQEDKEENIKGGRIIKVIEVRNQEVRCGYCKSLLKIEPYDVMSEPTSLGRYICNVYYICEVCKAKNYNVPDCFKEGKRQEYQRRMSKIY